VAATPVVTPRPAATTGSAAPAAAAPVPTPAAPAAVPSAPAAGITVRRGMPNNAEKIAAFITAHGGRPTTRMDVMLAFGQKSYLVAQDAEGELVGLMGWQVENLITRCDELVLRPGAPVKAIIDPLVVSVEEFSRELESEVGYVFLPLTTTREVAEAFRVNGYLPVSINQIDVPAWREAVMEAGSGMAVLEKRLRQDRVLQPI
jgi:dephospho-CoA kinase